MSISRAGLRVVLPPHMARGPSPTPTGGDPLKNRLQVITLPSSAFGPGPHAQGAPYFAFWRWQLRLLTQGAIVLAEYYFTIEIISCGEVAQFLSSDFIFFWCELILTNFLSVVLCKLLFLCFADEFLFVAAAAYFGGPKSVSKLSLFLLAFFSFACFLTFPFTSFLSALFFKRHKFPRSSKIKAKDFEKDQMAQQNTANIF